MTKPYPEDFDPNNQDAASDLQPNELMDPFVQYSDDGTPLKPGMVFYDGPLDLSKPLPPIKSLGPEYYINENALKAIENQVGKSVFPLDIMRGVQAINNAPTVSSNAPQAINVSPHLTTANTAPEGNTQTVIKAAEPQEKAYEIMQTFLKRIHLIVVNDRFYVYSGSSYEPRTNAEVARLVVEKCRDFIKQKSSSFVDGIVSFLLKEPNIFVCDKDIPRHLVAFKNIVLDIKQRVALQPSPNYLTLYEVDAGYIPSGDIYTPNFDDFLNSITGGDLALIERIWQMIGYILTPDTQAKCFFLLQGVPNSGKSVLANLIQKMFSTNAVMPLDVRSLSDKFATSELVGKAICSSPDLPSAPLDERTVSKLKQLTGNDPVSSDVKFGKHVKFICNAKFLLATNHALLTKTSDDAFYYRTCVIPFHFSVPREMQDHNLEERLISEMDGIVTKAVAAYFRLVDNGYIFAGDFQPNEVVSELASADMDLHAAIFEFTRLHFQADKNGIVFIEDAHSKFCEHFGGVAKNTFSTIFHEDTSEIFGGKKDKKRRKGGKNAISCIIGISFIKDINEEDKP